MFGAGLLIKLPKQTLFLRELYLFVHSVFSSLMVVICQL